MFSISMFAPFSMTNSTSFALPRSIAKCNTVILVSSSTSLAWEPLCSYSVSTSSLDRPRSLADNSTVRPPLAVAETSALCSMNSFAIFVWPSREARMSGVSPGLQSGRQLAPVLRRKPHHLEIPARNGHLQCYRPINVVCIHVNPLEGKELLNNRGMPGSSSIDNCAPWLVTTFLRNMWCIHSSRFDQESQARLPAHDEPHQVELLTG